MTDGLNEDHDQALSKYYGEGEVKVIITLKVDTKEADNIARTVSGMAPVEDAFLVTGDTDIVAKANFKDYKHLKAFVTQEISNIKGLKDTKTLMVVSTYKERGAIPEE